MAIPTLFGASTPVAGVTKTFPIKGMTIVGYDDGGTLTPNLVTLLPNATIICAATVTDAQLVAAMQDYIARVTGGRSDGGSGGYPVQASKQVPATLTTCT